ncbi:MAG: glucose-6-phosphate isomerase [Deltaproteobacteria bacterium]|nr:glucose-6-phosphate isomerase [Deltaproteobacteria bacterium]
MTVGRSPLRIDLNSLFQPAVKKGPKDLLEFEGSFKEIHQGIMALKKTGQLPYSVLPGDSILRDQVLDLVQKKSGYDNIVVLGIGGSALGASSIKMALDGPYHHLLKDSSPRLFVLDHIEPLTLHELFVRLGNQKNLFVVISKSGNTSETLAQTLLVKRYFKSVSPEDFVVITDSEEGFLRSWVQKENIASLPVPSGVGGRFSVFSPVGLFPLACSGVNITELLEGAHAMEELCHQAILAQNPAGLLAMTLHHWMQAGSSQMVLMPYADRLRLFSDWFAQLWGESLGKEHSLDGQKINLGSTPIKATGVTDQHSQLQLYLDGPYDKIIGLVEVEDFGVDGSLSEDFISDERIDFLKGRSLLELQAAELNATQASLTENQRPNFRLSLAQINEYQLGQLYQLFMNVIPYMGALMNINPFDQPAVEKIKRYTFGLMGKNGFLDYKEKYEFQNKREDLIF